MPGPTASYTFPLAGTYKAQCVVNGSVDYKCDYYKNYCLDDLVCAYKQKANGSLCAVKAPLAPFQISFVPPQNRATLPSPIEYCTETELATLACYVHNSNLTNIGVVKNKEVCQDTITITT